MKALVATGVACMSHANVVLLKVNPRHLLCRQHVCPHFSMVASNVVPKSWCSRAVSCLQMYSAKLLSGHWSSDRVLSKPFGAHWQGQSSVTAAVQPMLSLA